MFWRKKDEPTEPTGVHHLATQLGVEKRFSPRVQYPPKTFAGLPTIRFGDQPLRVFDISIGGCCLIDPSEVFGAQVGTDFTLTLDWSGAEEAVRARLVGRVDHRRNFQFIDLSPSRQDRIKNLIGPGVRGAEMRANLNVLRDGPSLEAIEMWSSPAGDSITVESHLQRVASVYVAGKTIHVLRAAWPLDERSQPIARAELEGLILFLSNVPRPSRAINELLFILEEIWSQP